MELFNFLNYLTINRKLKVITEISFFADLLPYFIPDQYVYTLDSFVIDESALNINMNLTCKGKTYMNREAFDNFYPESVDSYGTFSVPICKEAHMIKTKFYFDFNQQEIEFLTNQSINQEKKLIQQKFFYGVDFSKFNINKFLLEGVTDDILNDLIIERSLIEFKIKFYQNSVVNTEEKILEIMDLFYTTNFIETKNNERYFVGMRRNFLNLQSKVLAFEHTNTQKLQVLKQNVMEDLKQKIHTININNEIANLERKLKEINLLIPRILLSTKNNISK